MKHTHQRNIKIVNELMGYCYNHGSENIHIDINKENEKVIIFIKAQTLTISKEDLELLEISLNAQRCHEMEEYYWNLTGDNDSYSELTLVGMMIDEAHITYVDGEYLEILLTRIP
ncbi:hypothetical protein LGL55_24310 [Clostridium tagluense]|uniref:Uncharacterized protein n=1 Tax=Clostridium tagluense TaxID=360422 RepID=A0A401UU31_9CLOT|nr:MULTISPECIES: hypothetical protein [Clostridium]MBU3130616.1 hypothetical protein [Clostridium tagluense]MBW9159525.1 hypothetical protein [Clostridium tagluense]MBZ9621346.1 hypothetical protein [Clostridium sp. FP2]MCB2301070.1 hypothetical protein [Clostridium tagluense]MCB2314172.1 hypothetical protein [Clostridium tagluense]